LKNKFYKKMAKKIRITTLTILTSLVFPLSAKAAISNGGFESAFSNWETIGSTQITTSTFGVEPVKGNNQAFLSTAFEEVIGLDENFNPIIGGSAVPAIFISNFPNLEEFLNISSFLSDNSLDDIATAAPIEGSAIKQSFTAVAGQTLSFYWDFLTNESVGQAAVDDLTYPDFNDFAFVSIQSSEQSLLLSFADTISQFQNSTTSFNQETGFKKFSYKIPTSGEYILGLGVVDVGDGERISGLLIDEAQVVPESNHQLSLLLLGVLGTASIFKRSFRSGVGQRLAKNLNNLEKNNQKS
jgi:hypothetical protein